MNAAAAVARVSEIQAMLAQAQAPDQVANSNFQQQLLQASAAGPGIGATQAPGAAQSSAGALFSGLWPSATAVRACWASSMPAKASLGGGAPRAASGDGPGGPWAGLGEVRPFVMSVHSGGK